VCSPTLPDFPCFVYPHTIFCSPFPAGFFRPLSLTAMESLAVQVRQESGADDAGATSVAALAARTQHELPPQSFVDVDLDAAEAAADRRLHICKRLSAAAASLVETLSQAGSDLQRFLQQGDGAVGFDLAPLREDEDPVIRRAAQGLLNACDGIGVALVSLAVALAGKVQKPLDELQREVVADRARRKAELADFKAQHQLCAEALTNTLKRKQRLTEKLDSIASEKPRRSWFQKPTQEADLQRLASIQAVALEDFTAQSEALVEVSRAAQLSSEALGELLGYFDYVMKQTFHMSLVQCADAWEAAAQGLQAAATGLRADAADLRPRSVPKLKSVARPAWAAFPGIELYASQAQCPACSASNVFSLPMGTTAQAVQCGACRVQFKVNTEGVNVGRHQRATPQVDEAWDGRAANAPEPSGDAREDSALSVDASARPAEFSATGGRSDAQSSHAARTEPEFADSPRCTESPSPTGTPLPLCDMTLSSPVRRPDEANDDGDGPMDDALEVPTPHDRQVEDSAPGFQSGGMPVSHDCLMDDKSAEGGPFWGGRTGNPFDDHGPAAQ